LSAAPTVPRAAAPSIPSSRRARLEALLEVRGTLPTRGRSTRRSCPIRRHHPSPSDAASRASVCRPPASRITTNVRCDRMSGIDGGAFQSNDIFGRCSA
jgi:hypothetical protein